MSKCFCPVAAVCCAQLPLAAQTTDTLRYQLTSVMVPMRDGARLNTHTTLPSQKDPLPFVWCERPWNRSRFNGAQGPVQDHGGSGLHLRVQDIRGRYASKANS